MEIRVGNTDRFRPDETPITELVFPASVPDRSTRSLHWVSLHHVCVHQYTGILAFLVLFRMHSRPQVSPPSQCPARNHSSHSMASSTSGATLTILSNGSVYYPLYGKRVQKGHARLVSFSMNLSLAVLTHFNDYLSSPNSPEYTNVPAKFLDLSYKATLSDKAVKKTFIALGKEDYAERIVPSMCCAARCGNMYTASLYGDLSSLLSTVEPQQLKGRSS
jgi:hypothetical protein